MHVPILEEFLMGVMYSCIEAPPWIADSLIGRLAEQAMPPQAHHTMALFPPPI